ncbi:MAG: hypothetical protein AAAC47_02660 [Pararhizobium sp.]
MTSASETDLFWERPPYKKKVSGRALSCAIRIVSVGEGYQIKRMSVASRGVGAIGNSFWLGVPRVNALALRRRFNKMWNLKASTNSAGKCSEMDDRQKRALGALASMVRQYLEKRPDNLLDSYAMTAGERAIGALAEFGYIEKVVVSRTFGRWTEAGEALLEWADCSEHQAATFPKSPITLAMDHSDDADK